jgi:hypothetical protein
MYSPGLGFMRRHASLFIGISLAFHFPVASVANPTTRDATKPLATHNTVAEAGALSTSLYTLAMEAEKFVSQSEETLKKKGPMSLQPKLLSQWKGKVNQAYREAEYLQTMGEPASADLLIRLNSASTRLNPLIQAYASTPRGGVLSASIQQQLQKQQPGREKEYARIQGLVEAKQFAEAQKAIDKIGTELDESIHFIGLVERQPFLNPYAATRSQIDRPMSSIRIATARKAFEDAIAANRPDPAALNAWVANATGQLKSTGKATVDGKADLSGPQVLEALSQRWGAGHGGLQRVQGLRWALRWHRDGGTVGYGDGNDGGLPSDPTLSEATAWNDAAIAAISAIIIAGSESVPAADVPSQHQKYVTVLAAMAELGESEKIQLKGNEALASLLAKNSVYQSSVKNYEAATRDLMIFQSRIAQEMANTLSQSYGSADTVVRENSRAQGMTPGLYPENAAAPALATLYASADQIMLAIGPKLIGKTARGDGVTRISPTSKTSAIDFNTRTYGTTVAVTIPELQMAQMKQNLLVDDTHGPLSIAATKALDSAVMGNYVAVGGTIVSAQLESMIARFISMSDGAAIVVPRGSTVAGTTEQTMMNQMAVRIDIDPTWVQYDLGVFKVPGK